MGDDFDSFVDAGDLHWKIVSVYINKTGQVCLLSLYFDGLKTCQVKKRNVVDLKSFFVSRELSKGMLGTWGRVEKGRESEEISKEASYIPSFGLVNK